MQNNFMTTQDKNNQPASPAGKIIIYNTIDDETKIEVQVKDETVWLSQKKLEIKK